MSEVMTKIKCAHCGQEIEENSETYETGYNTTIGDCCRDEYSLDDDTGDLWLNNDLIEIFYTNNRGTKLFGMYHKDNDDHFFCEYSEEYWSNDYLVTVRNKNYSRFYIDNGEIDNISRCEDCGEYFDRERSGIYVEDHGDICECCEDNYRYCECYERYIHNDDDCECEDENNNDENDELIKPHDYKPRPIFHGQPKTHECFSGFELEIESKNVGREELAQKLSDITGFYDEDFFYLKHDGSLSDGFEIVSHPMTLDEHKAKINHKDFFSWLRDNGARSHDTSSCGLHVHLDKRKMTDGHKVRLGILFTLCKPMLQKIARRTEERWCQFFNKNLRDKKDLINNRRDRYEALNWTNKNTVEIRIFRGTLNHESFLACLELSHAFYDFTYSKHSLCCVMTGEIIQDRFEKFLRKNKNRYPNAIIYFEKRVKSSQLEQSCEL